MIFISCDKTWSVHAVTFSADSLYHFLHKNIFLFVYNKNSKLFGKFLEYISERIHIKMVYFLPLRAFKVSNPSLITVLLVREIFLIPIPKDSLNKI